MARIDWVDQGLENWAMWRTQRDARSTGWPTRSAIFDIRTRGGYREVRIPIIDHEAAVMDLAVQALQAGDERLHRTVVLAYLGDPERGRLTRMGIAQAEGIALSTVMVRLEQADRAIATWLRQRAEARRGPK